MTNFVLVERGIYVFLNYTVTDVTRTFPVTSVKTDPVGDLRTENTNHSGIDRRSNRGSMFIYRKSLVDETDRDKICVLWLSSESKGGELSL